MSLRVGAGGGGGRRIGPYVPPPLPRTTVFGSCPIGNDGAPQTAASVQNKWGSKASARIFFGATLTVPTIPAGTLLHVSWKPDLTITDAQIDGLLTALAGHVLTFWHESDNDSGYTGTDSTSIANRTARIGLWNRLYDRNVALGRPCRISHVFVGTFWSDSTSDTTRNLWMDTAKGDYIGLDYDGVHDLHTDPPPDGITYYANTGSQTSASNKMTPESRIANIQRYISLKAANGWTGYTVAEFGCQRAPWDTDGAGRLAWMQLSTDLFVSTGAIAVHWYDDRAGSPLKDDVLYDGMPEKAYWQTKIDSNATWTGW